MSSSARNGSHGEQAKTTPAVTRLRKLSLQQRPIIIISELEEPREISKKESHQSLTSLPTTSSHLSPRPDRRHVSRQSSPKASPRFRNQRQYSDLDIRNPKINRQSEFNDCHSNRAKTAHDGRYHGNSYQDDDDAVPSSARSRPTSRCNLLSTDSLSVDSLIDQWTFNASKTPNPLPPRPVGSEHFEAVLDEMTTPPRKEGDLQGPPCNVATKTVRISPLVQVTIGGSPRLQQKKRNK